MAREAGLPHCGVGWSMVGSGRGGTPASPPTDPKVPNGGEREEGEQIGSVVGAGGWVVPVGGL